MSAYTPNSVRCNNAKNYNGKILEHAGKAKKKISSCWHKTFNVNHKNVQVQNQLCQKKNCNQLFMMYVGT